MTMDNIGPNGSTRNNLANLANALPLTARPIGDDTTQTVNLRGLYEALGVGRDFSTWAKERIAKYGFVEGQDYLLTKSGEQLPSGTKWLVEYHVSIDMAKELAMVENNEKGRDVRRYFITCERLAKQAVFESGGDPLTALADPKKLRHLLTIYTDKVIALEATIGEQKPIVAAYERIAGHADGSLCVSDAAKALEVRPKDLFAWLSRQHWIFRRAGNSHWVAYQDKLQAGYLEHKVTEVTRGDGSSKITEQVLVTAKGLAKLAKVFVSQAAE